jgi:DNA-binding response OmpR family regulator
MCAPTTITPRRWTTIPICLSRIEKSVAQRLPHRAYHVEPSLNRVTGPGGVSRLEPKVMLVLVCLAERAGQVVPKDRLFRSAWPDTAVTDDVLTRAISELRRLFEDDPRRPRVIEPSPRAATVSLRPSRSSPVATAHPHRQCATWRG